MIPARLRPLLTRLKNPPANDDKSLPESPAKLLPPGAAHLYGRGFVARSAPECHRPPPEAQLYKMYAPTAIKLIEKGIGPSLAAKFQDNCKLEDFVWRAAMIIDTPMSKEERKIGYEEFINQKFANINNELIDIDYFCQGLRGLRGFKKKINVKKLLNELKGAYLAKIKAPSRPDRIDILINLFLQCLPGVEETFIDTQLRKMVAPFDIILKKDAVRVRKFRSKDEWFFWKGNYFTRQED